VIEGGLVFIVFDGIGGGGREQGLPHAGAAIAFVNAAMARRTRMGIDVLVLLRGLWWPCGRENDSECQKQRTKNEPNPHPDGLPSAWTVAQ
jgi:hypothetical protein